MSENQSNIIENKVQILSPRWAYCCLLILIWTRETIVRYIVAIIKRIPGINLLADMVVPIVTVILILLAFSYIRHRVRVTEVLVYLFILSALLLSPFIREVNKGYLASYTYEILVEVVPMVFLGACFDPDEDKELLYIPSVIGVVIGWISAYSLSASGETMQYDDMHVAYLQLPSVMYLIYRAFVKKKVIDILVATAAGVSMFFYGTRGPVLSILVFLAVGYLYTISKNKSVKSRLTQVAVIAITLYFMYSDVLERIAETLVDVFLDLGFSTRIFDFLLEGDLGKSVGRDSITDTIVRAIQERPFVGYGLLGDRFILQTYAHNLVLELWCHFGVIVGTFILLWIASLLIKAIRAQQQDSEIVTFLLMMFCMIIVKLMVSNSYILEQYFFYLIGLMLGLARKGHHTQEHEGVITSW